MSSIFDEKFEGAGYEESWTESVGAGCTIDEDANVTDVSSPANWGSQCCKFINASDTASYTYSIFGATAITYTRLEVIFTDLSTINDNSDRQEIAAALNATLSGYCWLVSAHNDGSNIRLRLFAYLDGSSATTYYSDNPIAEDTLYRVEIKWDSTNHAFEWKINGVSQDSAALNGSEKLHGTMVLGCIQANHFGATWYTDLVAVDNADWIGSELILPKFTYYQLHHR